MPETYRLKLFEDDGTTVAVEFSTDPAHAKPYLLPPENLASQDVDMATGRATIGGCSVELVDVAITPADPDTGYITSILADVAGKTARIGRRAHLEVLIGAGYENVLNGVIEGIELHESYSSFTLSLKDQRENERHIGAFQRTTTPSVYPRGVTDGFGYNAVADSWLVPPTTPLRATFTSAAGPFSWSVGLLAFEEPAKDGQSRYVPTADRILTKVQEDALRHSSPTEWAVLDQIRLLWRPTAGGAWHILEGLRQDPGGNYLQIAGGTFTRPSGAHAEVIFLVSLLFNFLPGADLPASGTDIDLILGYAGPTSEEWPFHLEGLTFGEALKNIYDGAYSEDGAPPIQYDSTAVLALTEPLRARITEPADSEEGVWKWTEDNIYAPLGAAPALDSQGRISPVRYRLPPDGAVLLELNDTNCEPLPGWNHSGSDAVNVVSVEYERVYAVASDQDPAGKGADGDGLAVQEVTVEYRDISSIAFLGERPVRIKAVTLVALGGPVGEPITGDVVDETGGQLAKARSRELVDRFLLGGQHFRRRVARSALGSRRAGDWCTDATSWTPNYLTGQRGAAGMAQIVRVQPLDTTWSEVELIDAGPTNTPVGAPTLGAVTVNAEGIVSVPVTVVAAGSEARVDYAINATEPAADSALWLLMADRTAIAATLLSPAVQAGAVVWIRARGEKEGRRPSAWTTAVTVTAASTPRVWKLRVKVDQDDGSVIVTWIPNAYALGVRLHYDAHDPLAVPSFATLDKDASLGTHTFAAGTVGSGEMFTVDAEPYPGWSGSAVSGAAGVKVRASGLRDVTGFDAAMAEVVSMTLTEPEAYYLKGSLALTNTTRWAAYEKLGAWPTLDETQAGIVDTAYLRHEGQFKSIWGHSVEAGTWHVIVVPFNVNLQAGTRAEGSITIVGLATVEGVLLTLEAAQFPTYNKLLWTMNDAVDDAGARYEVDVYRDDDLLEAGRNARTDDDGTTPGTADAGGYRDTGPQECVTEELCFFQTFVYTVVLKDSTTVYDDKIYTVNLDGLWAG